MTKNGATSLPDDVTDGLIVAITANPASVLPAAFKPGRAAMP
jgi:hypothetical protein